MNGEVRSCVPEIFEYLGAELLAASLPAANFELCEVFVGYRYKLF
jgi:hypothetical protein